MAACAATCAHAHAKSAQHEVRSNDILYSERSDVLTVRASQYAALIPGVLQETRPSRQPRRPLFRPANPVTKFVRPHLSAGRS